MFEIEPIWEPDEERVERSALTAYERWLEAERGLRFDAYSDLWRWSVTDLEAFWRSVIDYFAVEIEEDPGTVLAAERMPSAEWLPGARLSYVRQMFRDRDPEAIAIISTSELRPLERLTWGELERAVAEFAAGLRRLGVGRGDRVAAYLPNIPETAIAFLAVASLGAVWSCCSPDLGAGSVIDRFGQVEPKLLLTVDGYRYRGRDHDRRDVIAAIRAALPSLEVVAVLDYLGRERPADTIDFAEISEPDAPMQVVMVPFDHPLWILYTSGTTGPPKAIVHGHGGILLEQLKRTALHVDAKPEETLLWYTTTGWMMWNFQLGVLLNGCAIVLYDGDPLHPGPERLWDLAEESGATCLGGGSAYFLRLMEAGFEPHGDGRELAALHSVGTTGSPFPPEGYDWLAGELGPGVWIFSGSGGTDVCTSFVGGVPTLPVYAGEMQGPALGVDVQVWDEMGAEMTVGEVGEMVIARPMPSMPLGFWGDEDGSRLRDSYFESYPGFWRHGDWLEMTPRGGAIIHGRSDSTINRGGIRMGSSEIYRAVAAAGAGSDALVVDLPSEDGEGRMELFLSLPDGRVLDDEERRRIAGAIRERCSPRHVPDAMIVVPAVPRTLTGKVTEVPVKRILMGADPAQVVSRASLANPDAIDWFVAYARRVGAGDPEQG